jgi:hypothetical protein
MSKGFESNQVAYSDAIARSKEKCWAGKGASGSKVLSPRRRWDASSESSVSCPGRRSKTPPPGIVITKIDFFLPWSMRSSLTDFENSQYDPRESPMKEPKRQPRARSLMGSFRHFCSKLE